MFKTKLEEKIIRLEKLCTHIGKIVEIGNAALHM